MPSFEQDVYSSMASSISYDADSQTMVITYNSGKSYAYANVPETVARDTANAASVGDAINANIKGRYSFRRL